MPRRYSSSFWTSTTGGPETTARRNLEANARAALGWIETAATADGDGYVEYRVATPRAGWSTNAGRTVGTRSSPPTAAWQRADRACEIQGYVYDAQRRSARFARAVWR